MCVRSTFLFNFPAFEHMLSICFHVFVKSFFSKLLLLGSSDELNDSQAYDKQDVMKICRTILVVFCYLAEKGMCYMYSHFRCRATALPH